MEDTPEEVRKLVYDIVMSRSESERFMMCALMYEDAKELAKTGMPEGLSDDDQQAYIFKRIHGGYPWDIAGVERRKL